MEIGKPIETIEVAEPGKDTPVETPQEIPAPSVPVEPEKVPA